MTFRPDDDFLDPALAPPPAPEQLEQLEQLERLEAVATASDSQFDPRSQRVDPVALPQLPPLAPTRPTRSPAQRAFIGLGAGLAGFLVVGAIAFALNALPRDNTPAVYTGAPVEASDALDGRTVVGLDDTIAIVPDPQWTDVTQMYSDRTTTGPLTFADALLGAYLDSTRADGKVELLYVYGHMSTPNADPKAQFRAVVTELYTAQIFDNAEPISELSTSQGLHGAFTRVELPAEVLGETRYILLITFSRGEHTAVIEWVVVDAKPDDAEVKAFLDSIRIDA